MTQRRSPAAAALALSFILAATACAPGRAIHRGNWPDGRLQVQQQLPAPVATVRVEPVVPETVDTWEPSDPGLTAADFNRMGVLQPVFFAYDSATLGPDQMAALDRNIEWLQAHPGTSIIVEGHCDERGTRRYNLALGQRRGQAARDYLMSRGIEARRLEVVSYGEELPSQTGAGEMAWSANRRAEFVIVSTGR